ncbi:MAG: type II toxin-antitoxin system HicA family toxin [Planctomycetota bacterium]|jgi:predicted RNA binding protein YcfA (HicA-like mRNA interferase family)|nr:type II toxin-antitoxin system HicA family toxin [Planctomycetota bacterium]
MPKRYTAAELTRMLKTDGWFLARTCGSHFQYHHPLKTGTVTVPMHTGTISPKTANSVLRQAGLKGGA